MKLAVFGLGYVGSVTAACLAAEGHEVVGVDVDHHKVELINSGRSPVIEPGIEERLATAAAAGRLSATEDADDALEGARISLVCVGTPSRSNGSLDTRFVTQVARDIGRWLGAGRRQFHTVVFRSTLLPGTVERELAPALVEASGRELDDDFGVAVCPEFLREATAVRDFHDPPFTVVGVREPRSEATLQELFGFIDRPFHAVSIPSGEALKYACNAFHATKVSFTNEIARFCAASGADSRVVMDLFATDDRLNLSRAYLRPGFAFGGSCLPKDVRALLHRGRSLDVDLPMLDGVVESNDRHLRAAVRTVLESGRREVALLGLSFKTGTDDLRESPSVELAEALIGKGLDLQIYDEHVNPSRLFGTNKRFVEEHLPHLERILNSDAHDVVRNSSIAVLAARSETITNAILANPPELILDLTGSQAPEVEALPGYRGLAW